jgi:hypothetical protein
VAALVIAVIASFAFAQVALADTDGPWTYSVAYHAAWNANRATITGYSGPGGEVTIPSQLGGATNIAIAGNTFVGRTDITGVTFSSVVSDVDTNAFVNCTGLTKVSFMGSGVPPVNLQLHSSAFSGCSNLSAAYFYGNAPSVNSVTFGATASGFTVYYLSGATGFTAPPGPWFTYKTAYFSTPVVSTPASSTWSLAAFVLGAVGLAILTSRKRRSFNVSR